MPTLVPVETLVPISRFSRSGASKEFAKVSDGVPVTVLKNNEPAYFIISVADYERFRRDEVTLANAEARRQAEHREGMSFTSVDDLMADLDA